MSDDTLDESKVASAWDANAQQWADDVQSGYDLYRELYTFPAFLAFMPEIDGLTVIDLGCGEGANTRHFAGLGGQLTGIDLSSQMIARARDEETRLPLGIRYEVCSFAALNQFETETFDGALSTLALMDGPDFATTMREAHRVVVPGGFLCFSILHPCFITTKLRWIKSASKRYDGLLVGNYFEKSPFVEHWFFSKRPDTRTAQPFAVPRFPRTLSEYVNTICDAGFTINKIEEPRPDATIAKEHPWLSRWREHAPLVLTLSATKV